MLGEGFGGLAVNGVVGKLFEFVECGTIEVEKGGAGGVVGVEPREAGWIAGLEIAACA